MEVPKTVLNNFFEYQNQEPVDSFGAFLLILFRNVFWFYRPIFSIGNVAPCRPFLLPEKHHPILPEWFSFAVAKNIHVVVGPNQNELWIEYRFLIPISATQYS